MAAKIAGISSRMWGLYERGEMVPSLDVLIQFAKARNIKLSQLIPLEDNTPDLLPEPHHITRVPLIDHIPISGVVASDDELVTQWAVTMQADKKDLFALEAHGDSMAPKIEKGDIVICSPHDEFVNGKIYAVVTNDTEHSLKTVKRIDSNYFCIPFNPLYQPLIRHQSEVLRLIRVIEIIKRA